MFIICDSCRKSLTSAFCMSVAESDEGIIEKHFCGACFTNRLNGEEGN